MKKRPCTLLRLCSPCVIQAVSSGKANLQHKRRLCYRCYLPVLTGFTKRSLRRTHTVNTTYPNTKQKKSSLGKEFDPTVADCRLQGTASSPSSTVLAFRESNKATRGNLVFGDYSSSARFFKRFNKGKSDVREVPN